MTLGNILLLILALVLMFFFFILLYGVFMATCEDFARLAIDVHDHTKGGRGRRKR